MRAIDADKLKEVLEKNFGHTGGASMLAQLIDAQDTIQPEPHWIPVTERLPKEFGSYQVTTTHGKVATYVFVPDSISSHEYWKRCVTAWMPLPEPYKGVTT